MLGRVPFPESKAMRTKAIDQNQTAAAANPLKRRGLLIGAGAAGAAGIGVLAAKVMPGAAPVTTAALAAKTAVDNAGGYQLTPHVLRYYETTRA